MIVCEDVAKQGAGPVCMSVADVIREDAAALCQEIVRDCGKTITPASGFEDMIKSPYSYTRGEYLPYSDTCWVVGYSKEPT